MHKKNIIVLIIFFSLILPSYSMVHAMDDELSEEIHLSFSFEEPILSCVKDSLSVKISNLPCTQDTGKPVLPVKPLKILLPYGMKVDSISVEASEKVCLKKDCTIERGSILFPIIATNNQLPKDLMTNKISDNTIDLYSVGSEQSFRGFSLLYVNLHPVSYQSDGSLWYYPSIELCITCSEKEKESLQIQYEDIERVRKKIDNIETLESYYPHVETNNDKIDYLIITNELFANAEVEHSLTDLRDYRVQQGYDAELVTVENILQNNAYFVNGTWGDNNPDNPYYTTGVLSNLSRFNDTAAKIRNYIRYMHYTNGVEYVLLAGDADTNNPSENIIPVRGLFANESGLPLIGTNKMLAEEEADLPSDVYYACLDGTFNDDMDEHFGESPDRNNRTKTEEADLEAEVFVGRAPIDSIEEMQNFVSKTLAYEKRGSSPYYAQILLLGEYLGFPGVSEYGGNYKDEVKPFISDNCNIRTLYDRDIAGSWSKQDLIQILESDTPHLINHDGHAYYGYNLKMVNSDVDRLQNEFPFFVYSHGCMAGGFDNPDGYDCIAEHFTVETSQGTFAVIMNSRYGLGSEDTLDSPSQALDLSFFKALFKEDILELGAASHFSKEDNSWQINQNGLRWVYYETNLFGDPLLRIHLPDEDPPDADLFISLDHPLPGGIYYKDNELIVLPFMQMPVMIGTATITANAYSDPAGYVFGVEFFINNESIKYDTTTPYDCKLTSELRGKQDLHIKVYGPYGKTVSLNQTIYTWIS